MTIPDATEIVAELERLLPDWKEMEPGRWQRVEYALRAAEGDGPVFPTFESFIEWVGEDTSAEWDDGEVVFNEPVSVDHQLLVGFLSTILMVFGQQYGLGTVLTAPFKMRLPGYGAEPDILFIVKANLYRLRETFLDGPADLIVEVLSPESMQRGRVKKFGDYEAAGISEYWLIDREAQTAEFYRLTAGRYALAETPGGVYESRVLPGLRLPVAWLWQTPLPTLVETLRALEVL